ncbi:MAG: toxin-antitoxin system protein [Lachnospiraceae bacterium]|nr:toxin-antitoxin system protein [Lachnospiraceae bacterium]
MNIIYAEYNMYQNSIDIYTYAGYMLRIDCNRAEEGIKTTPCSQCVLNALAINNPLEYATLYLDGTMQVWVDAEDSLELW